MAAKKKAVKKGVKKKSSMMAKGKTCEFC